MIRRHGPHSDQGSEIDESYERKISILFYRIVTTGQIKAEDMAELQFMKTRVPTLDN